MLAARPPGVMAALICADCRVPALIGTMSWRRRRRRRRQETPRCGGENSSDAHNLAVVRQYENDCIILTSAQAKMLNLNTVGVSVCFSVIACPCVCVCTNMPCFSERLCVCVQGPELHFRLTGQAYFFNGQNNKLPVCIIYS